MEDLEIDVPPFFLCPISLQIMTDPVTVSTGITYDRESIEKWLFSGKNNTCPVTKQVLSSDCDLTPNLTLMRLIQYWCTLNASHGIERIPTPKPPINKAQIVKLLKDAAKSPINQIKCLRKLRSMANLNDANKRCLESAGAVDFLAAIINNQFEVSSSDSSSDSSASDEALSILYGLQLSESGLKILIGRNGEIIQSFTRIIQIGNYESRAYAIMLLKSVLEIADPVKLINLQPDLFVAIVKTLSDQISHQASKSALKLLINLCPWGRNRIRAVEANAVSVLIDILLESKEKRVCEMVLTVLDLVCQCAEGRAELLKHGAGLAIVSKKILRVSQLGSEKAVRIIFSVSRFSATASVVQEMVQIGVVAKLCLVIQLESSSRIKDKAREVLKLHAKAWVNSPCIPTNLLSSFPI
ncbi:E3 ubiquitin-protein ligase PUB22 [Euphorbia lathyris]|uniref:E3 ubiquitin-protein ligase PUB22 n=1 Tax=Euphorbia lathyris TaxID=212925 RepID=UPI003313A16B